MNIRKKLYYYLATQRPSLMFSFGSKTIVKSLLLN